MTKIEKILLSLSLSITVFVFGFTLAHNASQVQASVPFGNSYHATSTAVGANASVVVPALLVTGGGDLGSVVITGANTGPVFLYDATTTNINLRTGNTSTSTITVAAFPASTAAGTYTFDRQFYTGLIYDSPAGLQPTTTITYRQN